MQKQLSQQIRTRIDELKTLRDEIRLDLHLATMDLRNEWRELERRLPDPALAADLKEATGDALERLASELRRFRTRLQSGGDRVGARCTRTPVTCRPEDTLADAVTAMWDRDVGFLPVTDGDGRVVGVLTDRDACIAACTRGKRMDELRVGGVMSAPVWTCREADAVEDALALMRTRQVRRVPVVDEEEKVVGVIALGDLVSGASGASEALAIVRTLEGIARSADDAQAGN